MRTARTGFPGSDSATTRSIATATSSAAAVTVGTKSTMNASRCGSPSIAASALPYVSAVAPPSMSTGFARLASAERRLASCPRVSSANSGSSRPTTSQTSAHRIPSPPALVRMPTRRPLVSGWLESKAPTSISSSSDVARITPAWWKSASTAASEPASAAVCELAARCPARVVPLFRARIGLSAPPAWPTGRIDEGCRTTRDRAARRLCEDRPPTTRAGRSTTHRPCSRSRRTPRDPAHAPPPLRETQLRARRFVTKRRCSRLPRCARRTSRSATRLRPRSRGSSARSAGHHETARARGGGPAALHPRARPRRTRPRSPRAPRRRPRVPPRPLRERRSPGSDTTATSTSSGISATERYPRTPATDSPSRFTG